MQSSVGTGNDEQCDIESLKKEIENRIAEMDGVRQTPTGGTLPGDEGGCAFLALPSLTNNGGLVLDHENTSAVQHSPQRGAAAAAPQATLSANMQTWAKAQKIQGVQALANALSELGLTEVSELTELDEEDVDAICGALKKFDVKKFKKGVAKKKRKAVPLALYKACEKGDLAAVKEALAANGVDVNEKGEYGSPLSRCLENDHLAGENFWHCYQRRNMPRSVQCSTVPDRRFEGWKGGCNLR